MTADQEQQWIEAARQGDQSAFERIVDTYQRPVYNLVYRMLGDPTDAEDAAQETFLRAYHRLDSYQPERKFSTWILSIAAHHAIDVLRRRHLNWLSLDGLPPWRWLAADSADPEASAVRQESQDQVQRLLSQLPPGYRLVTILHYWYDMSYQEIAAATGLTESAIKSRLHRARLMLAQRLQAEQLQAKPGSGTPDGGLDKAKMQEKHLGGKDRSWLAIQAPHLGGH